MQENPKSLQQQISKGYQIATGLNISSNKTMVLESLYSQTMQQLKNDNGRVRKMLSDTTNKQQQKELAALAVVTNAILNLDEVITKN